LFDNRIGIIGGPNRVPPRKFACRVVNSFRRTPISVKFA